jgi:hypothetical protein
MLFDAKKTSLLSSDSVTTPSPTITTTLSSGVTSFADAGSKKREASTEHKQKIYFVNKFISQSQ